MDEDGVGDACDNCPEIDNGDQADANNDGQGDACQDSDEDDVPDVVDNCPERRNPGQADEDEDGVGQVCDNCPDEPNADQADEDSNGIGDACDLGLNDRDLDGVPDGDDNCPDTANPGQADPDDDGVGTACDNCPAEANANQADENDDGVGDACPEADRDEDGVIDVEDNCPDRRNENQADADDDGRGDVCDNCREEPNFDQADGDGDGFGDVCDPLSPRAWVVLDWGDRAIDFDLHVLHPQGEYFGDLDCWAGDARHEWCDPGYIRDAPREGDILEEQVRMGEPPAGWYTVGVDLFWREGANRGAARVTFHCGDNEPVVFGPRELQSQSRDNRQLWEVFRFNPADCSVDPINASRDLICRNGTSCDCPECDAGVCAECPEGNECDVETGECVDPCADVECPDGERCAGGECVEPDPGHCEACGEGGVCAEGAVCQRQGGFGGEALCLARCGDGVDCPARSRCQRGVCQPQDGCAPPDPCEGVECDEGAVCVDGECEERADRDMSDWGDGNEAPLCEGDDDCTDEENCRGAAADIQLCAAECEGPVDCPAAFVCCNTQLVEGGPFCMHRQNGFARFCQ